MSIAKQLLAISIAFFAINAFADRIETTIEQLGVNPDTGILSVTLKAETAKGSFSPAPCGQANQLAWSMESKGSDAILSALLSAYHTQSPVEFHYTPAKGCLADRQQGDSVFLTRR